MRRRRRFGYGIRMKQEIDEQANTLTADVRKGADRECRTSRRSALVSPARQPVPPRHLLQQAAHHPLGGARLKHSSAVRILADIRRESLLPCSGARVDTIR